MLLPNVATNIQTFVMSKYKKNKKTELYVREHDNERLVT